MPQVLMQMPKGEVRVLQEWSELRNNLARLGVDVIVMPKQSDEPDLSKRAFAFKDQALVAVFADDDRSVSDEIILADWLRDHQFTPTNHFSRFVGSDLIIDKNHVWFGFGQHSNFEYKVWLDKIFDDTEKMVRPLQMSNESLVVQPSISYLNQCFCPLPNGELLWYPDAFSAHSRMVIESWYKNRIVVSISDLNAMACTAVCIKNSIIIPEVSMQLINKLIDLGYNVVQQNMRTLVDKRIGCKSLIISINE